MKSEDARSEYQTQGVTDEAADRGNADPTTIRRTECRQLINVNRKRVKMSPRKLHIKRTPGDRS